MKNVLYVAVAALVVLAGCSGKSDPIDPKARTSTGPQQALVLEGWVLDTSLSGVADAGVTIPSLNATTRSDAEGHYGFAALPTDEALLVTVEAEGFLPASKSVTIPAETSMLLNFTLEPLAVEKPYMEVKEFTGFLACQAAVTAGEDTEHFDCGGTDPTNDPDWEFTVSEDLAGVVIEVEWEPTTALAQFLNLTVETVGFGDQDQLLAGAEGPSVLRTQINQHQAGRYYSQGGIVRVAVEPGTNVDDEEAGAGVALAFQQSFHVYASIFYVDPPSPTYSAVREP